MRIYEITIAGAGDELKDSVARTLCPDENHAPPCPVPWSFGYAENGLLLAVYTDRATAEDLARRVGGHPPVEGDPGDHPALVEQYQVERGLRA